MRKRSTATENSKASASGNGRAGCAVDPNAILCRREVASVLGITLTHLARLRRYEGFPIQPRGKGYITGRALLDWIESRNANAR